MPLPLAFAAALLAAPAVAAEPAAPPAAEPAAAPDGADAPAPGEPAPLDPGALGAAEPLPTADTDALRAFAPRPGNLPQNPYGKVDFTAYTLEWGEVKLGVGQIALGVLPRTQLSTAPGALALGVPNGALKVDLLRLGPVDLAARAGLLRLPAGDFVGGRTSVGGVLSSRLTQRWSLHTGVDWQRWGAQGTPSLGELPWAVGMFVPDAAAWQEELESVTQGDDLQLHFESVRVEVATDFRFNRRDSFILQARADVWAEVQSSFDAEAAAGELGVERQVQRALQTPDAPIANTYVATASWQFSWKKADLRVGAGLSSVPGAWLVQSTELSWRFGGKTRASERRMRTAWRQNRADLERAERGERPAPEAPAAAR